MLHPDSSSTSHSAAGSATKDDWQLTPGVYFNLVTGVFQLAVDHERRHLLGEAPGARYYQPISYDSLGRDPPGVSHIETVTVITNDQDGEVVRRLAVFLPRGTFVTIILLAASMPFPFFLCIEVHSKCDIRVLADFLDQILLPENSQRYPLKYSRTGDPADSLECNFVSWERSDDL